jgi:hypothetical protein
LPRGRGGSVRPGACCRAKPRRRSGSAIEPNTLIGGERERFGETARRLALRTANGTLEILNGAQADPGSFGEGRLSKPGIQSMLADQVAE